MIDDHPSQIEGYKVILEFNNQEVAIETIDCYNCESAYNVITNTEDPILYDLVFLDRSLPPYREKNIMSGEDLAHLIKIHNPTAKIIILTTHAEAFLLYDMIHKIEPAGLLVKSDFSGEELLNAFDIIINGGIYYSETVKESIRELLSRENYLDAFNRQIITLLSKGVKTKNMPDHLGLSQSAIEKRKVLIRDFLCVQKGNDEDIVREARRLGFI